MATVPTAALGASKDSNEGGEEEYGEAGEGFTTAGVEFELLIQKLSVATVSTHCNYTPVQRICPQSWMKTIDNIHRQWL